MIRKLCDPDILKTQRTGYPGPERQAISGTVLLCIVCLVDHPIGIHEQLTTLAKEAVGSFAAGVAICGVEASFIVEVQVGSDVDCYCKSHLEQEAREWLKADFGRRRAKGELSQVRDMTISHVEETTID